MANLTALFDEIKDTVNIDPKLKGLLQGLIDHVKSKDDIIVELQTRVHFLENKVNEMGRYSSKDCFFFAKFTFTIRKFYPRCPGLF